MCELVTSLPLIKDWAIHFIILYLDTLYDNTKDAAYIIFFFIDENYGADIFSLQMKSKKGLEISFGTSGCPLIASTN